MNFNQPPHHRSNWLQTRIVTNFCCSLFLHLSLVSPSLPFFLLISSAKWKRRNTMERKRSSPLISVRIRTSSVSSFLIAAVGGGEEDRKKTKKKHTQNDGGGKKKLNSLAASASQRFLSLIYLIQRVSTGALSFWTRVCLYSSHRRHGRTNFHGNHVCVCVCNGHKSLKQHLPLFSFFLLLFYLISHSYTYI